MKQLYVQLQNIRWIPFNSFTYKSANALQLAVSQYIKYGGTTSTETNAITTLHKCCTYAERAWKLKRNNEWAIQLLAVCNYKLKNYYTAFLYSSLLLSKNCSNWLKIVHLINCQRSTSPKKPPASSSNRTSSLLIGYQPTYRNSQKPAAALYPSFYLKRCSFQYCLTLLQRSMCCLSLGWYGASLVDCKIILNLMGSYEELSQHQQKQLWIQTQLQLVRAVCLENNLYPTVIPQQDVKSIRKELNGLIRARVEELLVTYDEEADANMDIRIHNEYALKYPKTRSNPLDSLLLIYEKLQPHIAHHILPEESTCINSFTAASLPDSLQQCHERLSLCLQYSCPLKDSSLLHQLYATRAKCFCEEERWEMVVSDCTNALLQRLDMVSNDGDQPFEMVRLRMLALHKLGKKLDAAADHLLLSELELLLCPKTVTADHAVDTIAECLHHRPLQMGNGFINKRRDDSKWKRTKEENNKLRNKRG